MSSKREHEDSFQTDPKRQKQNVNSPASEGSLLPGFNYGDVDDEENHRMPHVSGSGGDGGVNRKAAQGGGVRVAEEEEDNDDDLEQKLYQARGNRNIHVRRDCPYLDAVNRQVLDFDFEKLCSVSLSNLNVYACLVCGKYYQGRGKKSHANTKEISLGD